MMNKKTIVYIAQPTHGGAIEYLYMFLKNIDKSKYNNILILSEDYNGKIERFSSLVDSIYFLPMSREIKIKNVKSSVIKLRKILKKIKPDIIYMHSSMAGAVGRITNIFNFKVKLLYNAHGWYFNAKISKKKQKMYALIEKILAFRTTKIVNISKAEYDSALEYKIAPKKKMCLIENAIDFSKFKDCIKYREQTRNQFNIKENEMLIGVVGRLSEQKDPITILKAFEILCKNYKNLKLMYVGSGELEEEVKQYAKQSDLLDKIIITGWVNDVEKYIPAFDIAVLPSKWEGFGLAIVEYMVCNKPIIASNVGGITDIIISEKNGLLFEVGDYEELSKKINFLIQNNEIANNIVEENKKHCKKYDISLLIKKHEELFENM